MSFYTTLHCYRPGQPPQITGHSLANFVRAFAALGVSEDRGPLTVEIKFGKAIDQDERPSVWEEPIHELISVSKNIEWDLAAPCPSLHAVADALIQKKPVYRAFVGLGPATHNVCQYLQRRNSPENEVDLTLDQWSLEVGPIMSSDLDSAESYFVGWISVAVSGYGYLYPWTCAELVARAETHSAIRQVTALCKETWPVAATAPNRGEMKMRERMGNLWPYAEIERVWDWYWGVSETG